MEFLNRIELRGVVGRADFNSYKGNQVCNFSVVTEASAVDRNTGASISEPTWFNVTAWSGIQGLEDLTEIKKGSWVNVIGRLRLDKWTTPDNEERTSLEVQARMVKILPREELQMSPQRDY